MLKARLKTTGVVEHKFTLAKSTEFRGVEWVIYDVGGARNQRQAWAPYFDDGTPARSSSRRARAEPRLAFFFFSFCFLGVADVAVLRFGSERDHLPRPDQRV